MLLLWVPCDSRLHLPSCSILITQLSLVKKEGYSFSWQVELQEGPLEQFTHDMEPFLRKQGMPVRLNRGVVELVADYTVCTDGEPVSPEASRILRLLGVRMAAFHLHLLCRWSPGELETYETQTKIQVDNPSNGS
jgi:mRNA turnover protein 4